MRSEPACCPRRGDRSVDRYRAIGRVGRGVALLVLGWWEIAERGVQSLVVVPADPLGDRELGLLVGAPHAVGDQLGLE